MRTFVLAAGLAATLATAATAQESCEQRRDNRTVGTVAGAGIGAILGGAIAGRGSTGLGVVLGAVGGGVAGNQLARGPQDCVHAYGYYDNGGRWHGNRIDPAAATGFYDRDGRWVDGAPAGYYDRDGRWVTTDASRGYRDRNGYWVAAGAPGYYDAGGTYVTAQPVAAEGYGSPPPPPYGDPRYGGDPHDIRGRLDRTADRIERGLNDGSLTPDQAHRARADLDSVRRQAGDMARYHGGELSPDNERVLNARLDEINGRIRASRDEGRPGY